MTAPLKPLIQTLQGLRAAMRVLLRSERVTIADTSPLKVTLRDGTTVQAVGVTGLTYTVGSHGVALIADRSQPLVFPTA